MEPFLIDEFGEAKDPSLDNIGVRRVDLEVYILLLVESEAYFFAKYFFLYKISKYLFLIDDLKLNIEVKFNGSVGLYV
jgi:hypothetical protein